MKMKGMTIFMPILAILLIAQTLVVEKVSAKTRVYIAGGYDEIDSYDLNSVKYISLSGLADLSDGKLNWTTVGHEIEFKIQDHTFEFLLGSSFFRIDDSLFNMTFEASLKKGQLYVPAMTFLPFLDQVSQDKISWDPDSKSVRIDSDYFNVTDISFSTKANGLLAEIYLTTALNYEVFVTEGNWVNVSIRNGMVNRSRIESRRDRRFLYNLKAHQMENTAQVSFRLKRSVKKWHHKLVLDPPRIQISIADLDFLPDTASSTMTVGPDSKIDVIVVDAGHGGEDYGAIGSRGVREKDVSLQIAKRLAKLIRKNKQFKVIMTRDRDRTVSLEKRAAIANSVGADLFISIHANASPKRHIRGWNVFFLAPARNDSARAVAQLENSYFLREQSSFQQHMQQTSEQVEIDPVLSILNEMIMTEFQAESHDFAKMIDREFRRKLKTPARGIDQAGFFVLNKIFTPSVLIESAFISNKKEEKLLKNKRYQQAIAESIYNAIKRFKAKYESQ